MSTRRPLALLSRNRVSEIAPGDFRISGFFTNTMGIRSCEKRPDEDRSAILLLLLLFFFFFFAAEAGCIEAPTRFSQDERNRESGGGGGGGWRRDWVRRKAPAVLGTAGPCSWCGNTGIPSFLSNRRAQGTHYPPHSPFSKCVGLM